MLSIPSQPLQARYSGLYEVIKKVGEVNYILNTLRRRNNKSLCHVNMLKKYHEHPEEMTKEVTTVMICTMDKMISAQLEGTEDVLEGCPKLKNSNVLKNLQEKKLSHLAPLE